MAHVKCKYQRFECLQDYKTFGDTKEECDKDIPCEDCGRLQSNNCYFESESNEVDYDGEFLRVGTEFCAFADWDYLEPEMNYIDFLEIDGEQYIPEQEEKTEQ